MSPIRPLEQAENQPTHDKLKILLALLLNAALSSLFFGVTIMQLLYYYQTYRDDQKVHKCSVVLIGLLDATVLLSNVAGIVQLSAEPEQSCGFIVGSFMNIGFVIQMVSAFMLILLLQCLYCYRIQKLRGSDRMLPNIVTGGVAVECVMYLVWATAYISARGDRDHPGTPLGILEAVGLALNAVNEASVSLVLCYYLHRTRKFASFRWIDYLIHQIFSTGLFTSFIFIFFLALKVTSFSTPVGAIGFTAGISKLYVNGFLVMLNARKSLKKENLTRTV